jgi:hypothetical protein
MQGNFMRGNILRFFAFSAGVGILVLGLKFFNWLPLMVQVESMREYRDVEEVKGALQIQTIFVPSYFPQNLSWPPSKILAQGKPYPAVVMEFEKMTGKDTMLLISQSTSQDFLPEEKIKIIHVKESVSYSIKGRNAFLQVGECREKDPCSAISWKEGEYRIHVLAKSTPFELIKIAESMLR